MSTKLAAIGLGVAAALTLSSGVAHAGKADFDVKNNWGQAFGTVKWELDGITITGTVEALRANSFLYLSWNALGTHHNEEVAGVGGGGAHAGDHANFNRHFGFVGGPSNIKVTVCSQVDGKWKCGVPQGPL